MNKDKPLSTAIKNLSYRPRTEYEIKELLHKKGYSAEIIEDTVKKLINLNYLNDIKFIESWCHYRKEISPRGRWYVQKELKSKGISDSLIDCHFDQYYQHEEEFEILSRLMRKSSFNKGIILSDKLKNKLLQSLLRKGFPMTLILEAFTLLEGQIT